MSKRLYPGRKSKKRTPCDKERVNSNSRTLPLVGRKERTHHIKHPPHAILLRHTHVRQHPARTYTKRPQEAEHEADDGKGECDGGDVGAVAAGEEVEQVCWKGGRGKQRGCEPENTDLEGEGELQRAREDERGKGRGETKRRKGDALRLTSPSIPASCAPASASFSNGTERTRSSSSIMVASQVVLREAT